MTMLLRASTAILATALIVGAGGVTVASAQPAAAPKIDASGLVAVGPDRLFYEVAGQGPTIVLIHDGTIHREVWDGQVAFFAAGHRVVRYDRRRYGKSSAPTVSFSNLDDLAALFAHLKIDKACLMGMAAGGRLAVDFTLRHPEKVTSLVLVGAVVGGLPNTRHMYDRGGQLPKIDNADPAKALELTRLHYVTDDPDTIYAENAAARFAPSIK
jgi:pimeloyl-ACP methyl ester carboxylesterase